MTVSTGVLTFLVAWSAKGAIIIGVAAGVTTVLRKSSAAIRHSIWLAAILSILLLALCMLVLPSHTFDVLPVRNEQASRSVASEPGLSARATVLKTTAPISTAPSSTTSVAAPGGSLSLKTAAANPSIVILAVWLFGMVALLTRVLVDQLRANALMRRARLIDRRPAFDAVRIGEHAVSSHIRILVSVEVAVPLVTGLWRPVVILPASNANWTHEERWAILSHELGHVVRRDCLSLFAARLLCAVHWFNPIVWYAARAMRREAELACDDRVLQHGTAPLVYAELLLRLARSLSVMPVARHGLSMAARGAELKARLEAIVDDTVNRSALRIGARGLVSIATALMILPVSVVNLGAAPTGASPPSSPPLRSSLPAIEDALSAPVKNDARGERQTREPQKPQTRSDPPEAQIQNERITLTPDMLLRASAATATLDGRDSALARTLFAALEQQPQHAKDLVRERALWSLAHARRESLVEPLLELLRSDDWREQAYAAWALALTNDARATAPLLDLLEHPVWRARAAAANALAELMDASAMAAMIRALHDEAWQVRMEAVRYLGHQESADAAAAINSALRDPHIGVRSEAEAILASRKVR